MDVSDPVLWHTDLHLGNIFVLPGDPSTAQGIIGWQACHYAPLSLQAQFSDFLAPSKNYTFGPQVPALPDNFNSLSPEKQHEAKLENELALRFNYYEMSCLAHTLHVCGAMTLDRSLWERFVCAQLGIYGSLVPLREYLIQLPKNWSSLGLPGNCPYQITDGAQQVRGKPKLEYEETVYLCDLVKSQLQTNTSGWVPHSRWEMTDKRNRELYEMYIVTMSEELDSEAARR
jgi:hypothetical protein